MFLICKQVQPRLPAGLECVTSCCVGRGAQLRKQNQQNQNKQPSRKHGTSTEPAGHQGQMTLLHTDHQPVSCRSADSNRALWTVSLWLTHQHRHSYTSSSPVHRSSLATEQNSQHVDAVHKTSLRSTGRAVIHCASATPHHQLLQVYVLIHNVINQQVINASPYSTSQLQRFRAGRACHQPHTHKQVTGTGNHFQVTVALITFAVSRPSPQLRWLSPQLR